MPRSGTFCQVGSGSGSRSRSGTGSDLIKFFTIFFCKIEANFLGNFAASSIEKARFCTNVCLLYKIWSGSVT